MDSRLKRIGGGRLSRLRKSDVPRVAQAILDYSHGKARVLSGILIDTPYVQFVRDRSYSIAIRGDEWGKIYPFFRYSTARYQPVQPPENQPLPIPSPQPNRLREVPPESPDEGMQSFLQHLPYQEYVKIQKLLTMLSMDDWDQKAIPSKPSQKIPYPPPLQPARQRADGIFTDTVFYNRLVKVLEQLFPVDYPTTYY